MNVKSNGGMHQASTMLVSSCCQACRTRSSQQSRVQAERSRCIKYNSQPRRWSTQYVARKGVGLSQTKATGPRLATNCKRSSLGIAIRSLPWLVVGTGRKLDLTLELYLTRYLRRVCLLGAVVQRVAEPVYTIRRHHLALVVESCTQP